MELWGSEETGTFTVLLTSAAGQSCVLVSGGALMLDLPEQSEVGTRTGF